MQTVPNTNAGGPSVINQQPQQHGGGIFDTLKTLFQLYMMTQGVPTPGGGQKQGPAPPQSSTPTEQSAPPTNPWAGALSMPATGAAATAPSQPGQAPGQVPDLTGASPQAQMNPNDMTSQLMAMFGLSPHPTQGQPPSPYGVR